MRWRWWAVLPLAVVLVLVASASRLQMFWWPNELHDETTGRQLEPVAVVAHSGSTSLSTVSRKGPSLSSETS